MVIPEQVRSVIDAGGLFVLNHSGGKDSQAMVIALLPHLPREQVLLVHADLGKVEWDGAEEHIRATAAGLPLVVCRNENKDLLSMVHARGMFPSPQQRQCTSDLKRGPIERTIRRYLKANPRFGGLVVSCMGMRGQESPNRAKLATWKRHDRNSVAGRDWYDWLPIHDMTTDRVFETIREAGQEPHPVYAMGMSRFSCRFCIMASRQDLVTAAILSPAIYREYVLAERSTGQTMMMPVNGRRMTLEEITGVPCPDPGVVGVGDGPYASYPGASAP